MSQDIEEQLICLIKKSPWFVLQCDESTDIAQCCQLLIFVTTHCIIHRQALASKTLPKDLAFAMKISIVSECC